MKLRIRGNSIRLRLTQSEVENFTKENFVEESTDFGEGRKFIYTLLCDKETEKIKADFNNGNIKITVPENTVQTWANGNEVGIEGETETLKIIIEKDFTCLKPRDNGDDADTFPHPKGDQVC